jgi:hypothetical protein
MILKMNAPVVSLLLLLSHGAAASTPSSQATAAADILTTRYETFRQMPYNNPDTGGDLQVTCTTIVFREWTTNYLAVLDKTDIDPTTVTDKLDQFGHDWFDAEDNIKIAEYFRPGVTSLLNDTLLKLRAQQSIDDLDPKKMTLTDVQDALYVANLKLCLSQEVIDWNIGRVKKVNPSAEMPPGLRLPSHYTVSWTRTPDGGIAPMASEETSQPHPSRETFDAFGDSASGATYLDYLNAFQK